MAAVRMEDDVLKNWRFRALAQKFGLSKRWAWGLMFEIYSECTERNTEFLPAVALDAFGAEDGAQGLAMAIVDFQLGELVDGGLVRVKGCRDEDGESRISWLAAKRAAAKKGGEANRARIAEAKREPNASQRRAKREPSDSGSFSGSFSGRERDPDALARGSLALSDRKGGLADGSSPPIADRATREATVFMDWFNRYIRKGYGLNDRNISDVQTLLERGYTQGEMRLVARHQKSKWAEDEKMKQHVVPSAVLHAKKFPERLDDARATHPGWAEQQARDDAEAAAGGGIEAWERWAEEARLRSVP